MDRTTSLKSHIQLVVPERYLQGGAPNDPTVYVPFDGDVDTIEQLTPDTKDISIGYVSSTVATEFTLIYGHQGSTGTLNVKDGLATTLAINDYAESAASDWTITAFTTISRATSAFSSILCEHDAAEQPNLKIATVGSQIRQVMFSRDYRVPMHDRSWNCVRTFASSESESYLKQKYPRFHLRNEYREVSEHFFEWTGLTDAEKRVFDIFFAAFGGNITQPFAMCIINGLDTGMDCKMLIIDSSSVDIGWKRNREMQRDGLSFTALELIPN